MSLRTPAPPVLPNRRRRDRAAPLLGALLLSVVLPAGPVRAGPHDPVAVLRVIDGDTVVVRGRRGTERVRLLGVDAPERGRERNPGEPYARAATEFVRRRLAGAREVALEVAGDRVDGHGRTLGFLWLRSDTSPEAVNLSAELLRHGLARAIRFFDYPGKEGFLALEAEARGARRGVWGSEPDRPLKPPRRSGPPRSGR